MELPKDTKDHGKIYLRICNLITPSVEFDAYIYFLKRLFNFTLWQYPVIKIFWPKKIVQSQEQIKHAKKIEEFKQRGVLTEDNNHISLTEEGDDMSITPHM